MVDVNTQEKPQEDFYSSLQGPLNKAIGDIADPMVRLLRAKETSSQEEMKQKALREQTAADKRAEAARTFRDTQKQEFAKYDKLPERPKDTITQDTQQGLQGLAMLLPVAGLFLGAVGNTSGVNAMNAMTGILKGYKEGNDQRIAFETKKYESAIKEWEANYKKAKEGIDRAIEIAKTNYQAGVAEAEAAARKIGSTELAAMVRSKTLGEIQTMMNKVGQDFQAAKNRAATVTAKAQKPTPVLDSETGQNVFATSEQIAENPERYKPIPKETRSGATETRYSFNVAESYGQAVADLINITKLPKDTLLGTFAGMTGKSGDSLIGSLKNTFARAITPTDQRQFQQLISGFENNMARALGGGYASSGAKFAVEAYKEQVAREGDSTEAKALFLARAKQELGILAKYFYKRPGAAPFADVVKQDFEALDKAIPFSVDDVLAAEGGRQAQSTDSQKAIDAFGAYEPDIYEYGINPTTGKFARRRKAQ